MEMSLAIFDLPIQRFLGQFAEKSFFFDKMISLVAVNHLFKGMVLFSLLWFAWFYQKASEPKEKREERRLKILVVFFATMAIVLFSRVLQHILWVHQRPIMTPLADRADMGLHFPALVNPDSLSTYSSFPSDHAMYFFALATGLWSVSRAMGLFAFVWTTLFVCMPRVYLGMHHPSDIVAGAIFGVILMLIAQRILWLERLCQPVLSWARRNEGLFYGFAFFVVMNAALLFDNFREMGSWLLKYYTQGAV